METKRFDLAVLLTVTTRRLLCDMGMLYEVLGWLTDDAPYALQLGRFMEECAPHLREWYPELAQFDAALTEGEASLDAMLADSENNADACKRWLDHWREALGAKEAYDVPRIPRESHQQIGPLTELAQLAGDRPVHVVVAPTEE